MRRLDRSSYGSPLRLRDVGGIRVSTTAYRGSSVLPLHEHGHAYLCLVAEGSYRQRCAGHDDDCQRGLLLVHPEGHRHTNCFHPHGARSLDLFLGPKWMDNSGISWLLSDYRALHLPDSQVFMTRLDRELAAIDSAADLALQSTVLELLAQVLRLDDGTSRPSWMTHVLERLRDQPQSTPSLAELAALARVHPAHLARTFKRVQGLPIGEYQRRLRINLACQALRDPSRPIAGIAEAFGFTDQSHFARVFRRLTGQTPSGYRRSVQHQSH